MHSALQPNKIPGPLEPIWAEAQVAVTLDDCGYLLDDGRFAKQAASCLITPETGDRILTVGCRDGDNYIVHVLTRSFAETAELSVPDARQLTIRQSKVALFATEKIDLHSLRDIDMTAATGVLSLNACNLFTTVQEALVQNVRHFIGKAEQYLVDVRQLMKLHGRQTIITAEQDVKIDGERISVG